MTIQVIQNRSYSTYVGKALILGGLIFTANFMSCSKTTFSSGNSTPARPSNKSTAANVSGPSNGGSDDSEDPSDSNSESPSPSPSNDPGPSPTATPTPSSTNTSTTTECTVDKFASLGPTVPATVIDINSASGLAAMTGYNRYRLTADIVLTGNWTPLNPVSRLYLDGNGHSISGLNVNITDANGSGYHAEAGLFTHVTSSSIVNLKIISPTVTTFIGAGVIAGGIDQSCLENIEITNARLSATYQAGVIAGKSDYGAVSIRKINASVTILEGPNAQAVRVSIGAAGDIGGFFGRLQNGGAGVSYISQSTLQFDITADTPIGTGGIGGLVGTNQIAVQISDTVATGAMHCLSSTCYRGGRWVGNVSSNYPDPVLQNSTVTLTKTGSWDNFKDN